MLRLLILLSFTLVLNCKNEPQIKTNAEFTKPMPKLEEGRYNVAFLIMDGVYNTELTAPFDIFQHTIFRDSIKAMNTFTVANTLNPIRTFEGMYLLPDFDYTSENLPKIDILVIPSAEHHLDTDLEDEVMLSFVRQVDKDAQFMTSHCDGAFVLAKAGLLDDVVSTTFPSDIDTMRAMFPKLNIRKDILFVHDGKYITSAGGAKSFEAALYLSEYLYGKDIAQSLAGGLVIDWNLDDVPHLVID
ncbi:DJ-1/PfpI family protein [Ichthyenterobacterium sp. W332]|uniref:DJ-1/PfpI family protein n=1 Tax=Microcosmobacter mediterraneus TaxID=3075607 RepID=A0ABU2YJE0_9FLAO|nr:DJ-1/PfpI family protein [Ichthyenterobacterium sp. W332]MDT0558271.1 DJ-1/PfpI family protein [Ichthyenterobacterium sp. W332]